LTLRWQETGDPDDLVVHPVALGGGVAVQALRRVADTVRSTQTDPEASTGPRLLGRMAGMSMCRCGSSGSARRTSTRCPLRRPRWGSPVRAGAVSDALRLHAGHRPLDRQFPDPIASLVVLVARLAGVLDLEWTRDAEVLRARLEQPIEAGGDVVLTAAEEIAYQRVVTRFNRMWTLGNPLDRFTY